MHAKTTKWAVLLAMTLAGCSKNESKSPATGGTSGGGTETATAVDVNDADSYEAWLRSTGVETPVVAPEPAHRGSTDFAGTIFPIYPRGDVRVESLNAYRVDIDIDAFRSGGSIQFRLGKKVLWQSPSAFNPPKKTFTAVLPKDVVKDLKVGDEVTWGVFDLDKKGHDVVAKFKVVSKPSITKAFADFDSNKRNRGQSDLARQLGHDQILFNHGLHSEALASYLDIVAQQPSLTEAWRRIVESLRRLDLKKTPLFFDAMIKMGTGQKARDLTGGGGIAGNVGGSGGIQPAGGTGLPPAGAPLPGELEGLRPEKVDLPKTTNTPEGDAAMGAGDTPTTPTPAADGTIPVKQAVADAQKLLDAAKKHADLLQGEANKLQGVVNTLQGQLDSAKKAVTDATKALEDYQAAHPDLTGEWGAGAAELAAALAKAQADRDAAQASLDTQSALLAQTQIEAEKARLMADQAARDLADLSAPLDPVNPPTK
jgi:hypothetical protein